MNLNINTIKNVVTSKAGMALLTGQKHSPAILFGAGVVGMVGTVVLASRATLHVSDVLDEFEDKKAMMAEARETKPEQYTTEMQKSDKIIVHSKLIMEVCKLYAPAVGLGVLSLAALGGSHIILTRRNAQLTAALTAVSKAFKEYRSRVSAELGEEKDREFLYGTDTREVYSEKKNGEPKVTQVKTFGQPVSPYARIFDEDNLNWQDTPEYNAFFLRLTQNYLNDRLRTRGHVFLNDAYRELGMTDTEEGAVTGWIWGDEGGDQYIDFGIWTDNTLDDIKEFMRNKDGAIMLDFNVDGAIYKKIGKGKR